MQTIPRLIRWILALAFLFLLLMTLMRAGTYYFFRPAGVQSGNLHAFWLGFRYDAREVGVLSVLLLLLGSFPALHPFRRSAGRGLQFTLVGLALLLTIIFYTFDFLHFRYLLQRLNASALAFLEDAKISGSMVWQTYPVLRIVGAMLIIFLLLFWLVRRLFQKIARTEYTGGKPGRIFWGIGLFLVSALAIFGRVGQFPLRWSDAFAQGSDFQANLSLNPFQSFFSSYGFRSTTYNEAKVRNYYPLLAGYLGVDRPDSLHLNYDRRVTGVADSLHRPNIVLVICESFSGYKSSMWGNPLNTTPYFNQLCQQGLFFDNCFTPLYGTARGVWAAVTGIPDVELNKTASRNPAMVDQHSIINDFAGYEKYYFLGGSTSWANIRGLLTNNIRDLHLYEEQDYAAPKIDVWGISDKNLFLEANAVLKKQPRPFFAVIQTADNHRPYTIPEADLAQFKKMQFPPDSLKKYGFESNDELNAFRFTDYGYEQFIEAAKKEPYFSNTIFLFIGDHGIAGDAGKMFPRAWTDQGLTYFHVPMLIYSPALVKPRRLHCLASQVDVLPTLAGLAGISYRNSTLGRDLNHQWGQDSGHSNMAYIMDPNSKDLGIIRGPWFYTRSLEGNHEKMVWADFSRPEDPAGKDSLLQDSRKWANAFYETSRYLLLKNRK